MISDIQLKANVIEELNWEPSIAAEHIGVTARDGVITLSGLVDSYPEKKAAETAAGRVKGVSGIAEEIEVRLPVEAGRSDEEIAAAAIDRLGWDVFIPKGDAIKIRVEKGWVTLTGEVEWNYEKTSAEDNIKRLFGVVGVSNQIIIKPRLDAGRISDKITHALHRSWFFDPTTITVGVDGGHVRLGGTATSKGDRQIAAATAWGTHGVTAVDNAIVVN